MKVTHEGRIVLELSVKEARGLSGFLSIYTQLDDRSDPHRAGRLNRIAIDEALEHGGTVEEDLSK